MFINVYQPTSSHLPMKYPHIDLQFMDISNIFQHTKQQRFCGFHLRGKGVFGSQGAPQVGPNGSRSPLRSAPSWNLHGGWESGSRLERQCFVCWVSHWHHQMNKTTTLCTLFCVVGIFTILYLLYIYIHTHYYTGYLPIQHASPTIFCI